MSKMETVSLCEMLATMYWTAWCHNLGENKKLQYFKNLKYHTYHIQLAYNTYVYAKNSFILNF